MYNSIRPGQIWLDTSGKPIQAHGFSVFYENGIYYWYGENKEFSRPFGKVWTWGIRCYASKDLYNWEDKGLIIPPEPDDLQSPLHPTYCVDRPHIVYCEKTGKYVAWIKVMGGLISQFMCVMQSDSFLGPYEFVHKYYHPLQMDTGDFTLCKSEKKYWLIFERPHNELITAELNESCTGVTGKFSTHFKGLKPPFTREAPAYFCRNEKHYLFTSGTSGYYPNPTRTACFTEFNQKYTDLGVTHEGDKTNTSFNSQISCVFRVNETGLYIAAADRWLPGKKTALGQKLQSRHYQHQFRNYEMDRSPRATDHMSGKEQIHMENTRKSRYVWLPVEWKKDVPFIRWYDEWKIEDFV